MRCRANARDFSSVSRCERKREREREAHEDKNQLECHVDKRRAYFPVFTLSLASTRILSSSCSSLSSRSPFAKDSLDQSAGAELTGLPAVEKPGCRQACSLVRELRDAGSAVDLSRKRVRRQFVQPDVRSFLGDRRESRANVTSSLDAAVSRLSRCRSFYQRKKFRLLLSREYSIFFFFFYVKRNTRTLVVIDVTSPLPAVIADGWRNRKL